MENKSSARKIASARANGAKSKGPVTPEGKARSSKNAIRSGLAGNTIVLEIEDRQQYDQLYEEYIRKFQPADQVELDLVEAMVNCRWRIRRTILIETETINHQIWEQEKKLQEIFKVLPDNTRLTVGMNTLMKESTSLETLQRYETRLTRQYHRAYKTLLDMRKNMPVPDEPNPESEQPPEPVASPVAKPICNVGQTPSSAPDPVLQLSSTPNRETIETCNPTPPAEAQT